MSKKAEKTQTVKVFDLASRRVKETIDLPITDPMDDRIDTGIRITLAGRYSKQARAAQFAIADADRANADGDLSKAEELDERLLALIAACTVGWSGITINGVEPKCDEAGALALYREFPWIREQVQGAYLTTARFFEQATTA
jgi:hypothetical protein